MRCIDCGEREATVVWIQAAWSFEDVEYRGEGASDEPVAPDAGAALGAGDAAASSSSPVGPNVCEPCARRRYEAHRPAAGPGWDEFLRLADE